MCPRLKPAVLIIRPFSVIPCSFSCSVVRRLASAAATARTRFAASAATGFVWVVLMFHFVFSCGSQQQACPKNCARPSTVPRLTAQSTCLPRFSMTISPAFESSFKWKLIDDGILSWPVTWQQTWPTVFPSEMRTPPSSSIATEQQHSLRN